MTKKIFEGVKFGEKEKALILKNAKDFNVGIEYEMHYKENLKIGDFLDNDMDDFLSMINAYDLTVEVERIFEDVLVGSKIQQMVKDGMILIKLFDHINDFDRLVKKNVKSDEQEDDEHEFGTQMNMVDDEKTIRQFYDAFMKILNNGDIDKTNVKRISSWNRSYIEDIMRFIDLYYEGEMFNDENFAQYSDYLVIISKIIDGDEKHLNGLIDSMANTELLDIPSKEDIPYEFAEFDEQSISFDQYTTYREDHATIPTIDNEIFREFSEQFESISSEIPMHSEGSLPDEDDLKEHGVDISKITGIKRDNAEQAEVITTKMNVIEAFKNIDQMFNFMISNSETSNYSGMHISISTNKYNLDDFNLMKFVALLDLDHVLDMFPERQYVENLEQIIDYEAKDMLPDVIEDIYNSNNKVLSASEIVKTLTHRIEVMISYHKEQSIKFGDYKVLDGRIELRFFGGEDYHLYEDEIKHHLLRALYLLNFAYTDTYNNVFYKKMVKIINKNAKEKYNTSLSNIVSVINRANKIFPKDIAKMYDWFKKTIGQEQIDDIKQFDRYMSKAFGEDWMLDLDFLRGLE